MKFGLLYVALYVFSFLTKEKAYAQPYESNGGTCKNNVTEYIPTGSTLCCSRCKPGHRLEKTCTSNSDTTCLACDDGMYSDTLTYHTNCFSCNTCDERKKLQYSMSCTKVSNAVCECIPGYYCSVQNNQRCSQCKRLSKCPPGKGATSSGTPTANIQCTSCPEGTFSNETSSNPCQAHTQCEAPGMDVERKGDSKTDTICRPSREKKTTTSVPHTKIWNDPPLTSLPNPTTTPTFFVSPPESSVDTFNINGSRSPNNNENTGTYWIVLGVLAVVLLMVLLTVITFITRHRKGLTKPRIEQCTEPIQATDVPDHYSKIECEHLLADNKTDPSTSSTSSASDSQSTGVSQDSIHMEQPVVSSPCVNVSITATFNCQLNHGSCSIPISPQLQPQLQPQPQPQPLPPDLPLSQEEQLRISCEEENSKDALQSVQESGMTVI